MFTLSASDASYLERIRSGSARVLVGLVLLHGPALAAVGWLIGSPILVPMLAWLGIAAAVTVAFRTRPNTPATRATIATALCLMPALVVELLAGHAWQIDAHMYFFAALAVTALLLDFGALLAASIAIALHHLVLEILLPSAVFPASSGLPRVLFHAVIVIFEAVALGWLITRTVDAFAQVGQAQARTRRESALRAEEQEQSRLRLEAARQEAAGATADELERALGAIAAALASSASDLSASADALATAAETTSLQAGNAARDARETGIQIGTVAAASEQMTASVDEIDVRMAESLAIATEAVAEMGATDSVVDELSEGAHRIDEVVHVIARITAQTNLLALNATIEAARAGDAGRGFSVVAAEVKALAAQTARAADEIGSHIKHMRRATDAAVQAIRRVRATIERSGEIAAAIASAMTQQGSATHEISRAAHAVAEGTDRVVERVNDVSTAATTASEAVGRVRSASLEVARQGSTLRHEIETVAKRLRRDAA